MRKGSKIEIFIIAQIVCAITFFYPHHVSAQDFTPTIAEIKTFLDQGQMVKCKAHLFPKISKLDTQNGNAIIKAKHYDLAGEYFFRLSDIGEAFNYWSKSNTLLKNSCGEGSIYLAENLANISKYYSQRIYIDSAYLFAQMALNICHKKKDSLKYINAGKVYREYGYSLKIKFIRDGKYLQGTSLARQYYDSATAFHKLQNSINQIQERKLLMDIGNTFTDEILYFRRLNRMDDANAALDKANSYYNKVRDFCLANGKAKSEEMATVYQVQGLANSYCYLKDDRNTSIEYYQKGIVALTNNYSDTSIFSAPPLSSTFISTTKILTLLRYKMDALLYLFQHTGDKSCLKACYEHSKLAIEVWKREIQSLNSQEIHHALETISAVPFSGAIPYAALYFQITGIDSVAKDVFEWMDLNKYSVLLKDKIESGSKSSQSGEISVLGLQNKLNSKQAVLEYFMNEEVLTCVVVTKNTFKLFPLDTCYSLGQTIDSLLISLRSHNSESYCRISKKLYDIALQPYLKSLSMEVTELTIIPHGKLSLIPFDALVINYATKYNKADFLINHYQLGLALSCNLLYNSMAKEKVPRRIDYVAPDFNLNSDLPFSRLLVEDLKSQYRLVPVKFNSRTEITGGILHIATHAQCDLVNSRNSYFLLSDEKKMFMRNLAQEQLKVPLVILSACETGLGNLETEEGIINFSRQFYLAGIKSTITTLWKVDDQSTAQILKDFYRELDKGQNSITSLHQAKLDYLKSAKSIDDYDPYYWSGLIYTGAPLSLEKIESGSEAGYWLVGGSVLMILILLLRRKFF